MERITKAFPWKNILSMETHLRETSPNEISEFKKRTFHEM